LLLLATCHDSLLVCFGHLICQQCCRDIVVLVFAAHVILAVFRSTTTATSAPQLLLAAPKLLLTAPQLLFVSAPASSIAAQWSAPPSSPPILACAAALTPSTRTSSIPQLFFFVLSAHAVQVHSTQFILLMVV